MKTEKEKEEFELAKSEKKIGQLYPILVDKKGNIIDGYHRQNANPDWKRIILEDVDTDKKLILARLTANATRRTAKEEEWYTWLSFLRKEGLTVQDISEATGIPERTIYNHLPEEVKDQAISEGTKIGMAERKEDHNLPNGRSNLATCDNCGLTLSKDELKPWNSHNLCAKCLPKALDNPAQFHQRLEPKEDRKEAPQIITPSKDNYEERKAHMQVQKSKMELDILEIASQDNELRPVQTDRKFCLLEVTPDLTFPRHNLAVFLDGKEAHENRIDRDLKLREQLAKRHAIKVLSITYEGNSDKEKKRILELIKKAV